MLKALVSFSKNPIVLTILALVVLFGIVFFGGRYLRDQRLITLSDGLLVLVYGASSVTLLLLVLWFRYRALKRSAAAALRKLDKEGASRIELDRREEMRALQSQFDEALDALRSSRLGTRAREALPWYVLVGPPGAGKTTMLSKSGLNFPYTVQGRRRLHGISGTRNCDWWFTDQGILLDTAGRYTTEADDRREWLALLSMVRRARKERPINGVVVTISMEDLLSDREEKTVEYASRIRERLADLTGHLELVFPIYLVFTKCDVLPGFIEMFRSLDREDRAQVWGCTLESRTSAEKGVEQIFEEEFARLYDRLCGHRLTQMASDRSPSEGEKLYEFPVAFAVAKGRLAEFVRLLVQPNPYHEGSHLRGFYFTSGTQSITALDHDDADRKGDEGVADDRNDIEAKSYFIDNLFGKVIFPDHTLARPSSRAAIRKKVISWSAIVGSIAATLAISALLIGSYTHNLDLIKNSTTAVHAGTLINEQLKLPLTEEQKRYVDALRDLFTRLDENRSSPLTYLLDRSDNLYPRVRTAYADVVKQILLTPLVNQLRVDLALEHSPDAGGIDEARARVGAGVAEAAMAPSPEADVQETEDAIQLKQQLRLYEMIGNVRPDPRTIRGILEDLGKWDENWQAYAALDRLVSTEMSEGDWAVEIDREVIELARGMDLETPLALIDRAVGEDVTTLRELVPGTILEGVRADEIGVRMTTPDQLWDAQTRLAVLLNTMPGLEQQDIDTWQTNAGARLLQTYVREWKHVLEDLEPVPARSLEDALDNLKRHTSGRNSVYKRAYLLVRANLAELAGSLPAGEKELAAELDELRSAGADAIWLNNALEDLRGIEGTGRGPHPYAERRRAARPSRHAREPGAPYLADLGHPEREARRRVVEGNRERRTGPAAAHPECPAEPR